MRVVGGGESIWLSPPSIGGSFSGNSGNGSCFAGTETSPMFSEATAPATLNMTINYPMWGFGR